MKIKALVFKKDYLMSKEHEYRKGDRVRIVHGSPAAPQGTEATIIQVYRDSNDTITALDVLITSDPTQTHGTRVFPNEVELLPSADHEA